MRQQVLVLMAAIVLTFSACSKASDGERRAYQNTAMPETDARPATGESSAQVGFQKGADTPLKKTSIEQSIPEPAEIARKIIRSAELTIESQNPEEAFRKVASLAESKSGFVVTSEATQPEGAAEPGRTTVTVVVRVPAAQFDATVEEIRKAGDRVLQDKRTGQDVTEEYIDLQARLQAKKALETQFLEIMKRAQKVEEALQVQEQLSEVRSEIEQVEGRRRFLESQSSLSTIRVTIRPPIQLLETGGGIKEALRDGLGAAQAIIMALIRVMIAALPILIIFGIPAWMITRYWLRRSKREKLS